MDSMDNFRERFEALEQQTEQLQHETQALKAHTRAIERRLRWWRGMAWGVFLVSLVSLAHPSQAADFTCAAGDVACLINAINTANANGEANTITLDVGVYTIGTVDNDTDGPNGLPSITSALTITGAGAHSTIIERDFVSPHIFPVPAFRLVHIATGGTLTLTGVTVRGGLAQKSGGILNLGSLTLTHSIITHNAGGLANTGTAILTHSTIASNTGGDLGVILIGGVLNTGTLTLIDCLITDNAISNHVGVGVGGILNIGGQLSVIATTIAANTVVQNDTAIGGFWNNGGTATLTQSTVAANRGAAFFLGSGGIENDGQLTILNSTIAGNTALGDIGVGGLTNSGTLTLLNSTIADNAAFADNAPFAGDIRVGGIRALSNGTVTLQNTLLARNTTQNLPPPVQPASPDCAGQPTSLDNNLIGDPTGCAITLQPNDLTGDPGLATFRDNGKPGNGHFPLLPTSQAIDAGNDAVCPAKDQIGQRRIGPCDIGAIRFLDKDDRQHEEDPATAAQASQ